MASPLAHDRSTSSLRLALWRGGSAAPGPVATARHALWQRLARALRAAGPDSRSRPLLGVMGLMGDVHCARESDPGQRLRGG